jgi:hypothetical protein
MLLILSFLSCEISDIIELITLIFHQVIQFITLAIKKIENEEVKVINKLDKKDPTTHKNNTFFLPKISDNCHKTGQEIKEKKE